METGTLTEAELMAEIQELRARLAAAEARCEQAVQDARTFASKKQEQEERYRAIIEAFDGIIYICSPDYRIEYINPSGTQRTGQDITGGLCYRALHDRDSKCPWCVNDEVHQGKSVRWEVKSPKDDRWYYASNTPVHNADGTISKLALIQDITERKLAEISLQEANQDLENKVLKRTQELREKDHLLIQKSRMAAMGEMTSYIAHQWRQPLNNLGLLTQQIKLLSDLGELKQEDVDHNAVQSMNIIQHMSKTIDDFINFCRPDKTLAAFNVADVIRRTVKLLEIGLASRNITVKIVEVGQVPSVFGNENEYAQTMLALLQNARDVFQERKTPDPSLQISIGSENGRSIVTVSDNAGGIPDAILDKIFDPYFSTKSPAHGSGLGLFMSRTIIENNMRGKITVRNTATGAEFRIEV